MCRSHIAVSLSLTLPFPFSEKAIQKLTHRQTSTDSVGPMGQSGPFVTTHTRGAQSPQAHEDPGKHWQLVNPKGLLAESFLPEIK